MTHLSPRAIEAGAKALCRLLFDHADLDQLSSGKTRAILEKEAAAVLTALEAEGMVVVPKRITDKMIFAVIDATDKKHSPLSCTEFWDVALQAAQGGDDAGQ